MIRARDLPSDVRARVCNGGGPAAGPGAWLVPDLLAEWTAAFNDHDAGYCAGGDSVDRLEVDQRMRRDLLVGANAWASARGISYARTIARTALMGPLVLLAVWLYYVGVRLGGGSRWLGSWTYREAPATAQMVIREVRAEIREEKRRGQGDGSD